MKHIFTKIRSTLAAALCATSLTAQETPSLPCCIDFDGVNPETPGYQIDGTAVTDLGIRFPGPSGGRNDGYLHAKDARGGSWARLLPGRPQSESCFGDWKKLIKPGRCLELCWDVNLRSDGLANSEAQPAKIHIFSGDLRATFITNESISEESGWKSFCAPIAPANEDGTLPSNAHGQWQMRTPVGGPPVADLWKELLCKVDQIAFRVDCHGAPGEEWCWDNVCLRDRACDECMVTSTGTWDCIGNAADGNLTYTFNVTNQSSQIANVLLVPPTTGFTVGPAVIELDPDLAPGDTGPVTLEISGASPGSEICFDIVLFNLTEGECCRKELCLKVPCVKISDQSIECAPTGETGVDVTFEITNITGGNIASAYLLSTDPGVAISPEHFEFAPLASGTSTAIGAVRVDGHAGNDHLCLYLVLLDREGRECCIQKLTFRIPRGCRFAPQEIDTVAVPTRPCFEGERRLVPSPDRCVTLCRETVVCDPDNPTCAIYRFTVTNTSTGPLDHILFPGGDVTPGTVTFPTPLAPGEASQVTVKINGHSVGPFAIPMVFVNLKDCNCCHFSHLIEIPECGCALASRETLTCEGQDPDNPGLFCFNYSARVTNLSGGPIDHLFLIAGSPAGVTFNPSYIATGSIPNGGFIDITSSVKIPVGTATLEFHISLHDASFNDCCAVAQEIQVPECCDCEETFTFEGGGPLPDNISLLNLQQDRRTGKIGFAGDGDVRPFPYVYMAASSRGTIVRIDANTGAVLGEYFTAPTSNRNNNVSPSRTTVDQFGECWVGNRINDGTQGSVARLGLAIGGTRGDRTGPVGGPYTFTPNPAGQYLQGPFTYLSPSVIDRDGDGFLHTSSGLTDILAWDPSSTGGNDTGGVSLAEDELIVNYVRVTDRATRGLAIDSNNDLWVGGTGSSTYDQVSGTTGNVLSSRVIPGGYGALIDSNNVLWSMQLGSGIHRHDISTNTTTFISLPGAYGLSIDPCSGNIWSSSSGGATPQLYRVDPTGVTVTSWNQGARAQGLAVDRAGNVWVACYSPAQVRRFDLAGTFIGSVGAPLIRATGVAVDHNGSIWASDYNGDAARRIDPGTTAVDLTSPLGAGARPYNYSDMTGAVAIGAVGETGSMVITHDSLCPGTKWGRVTWADLGTNPQDGCTISVEVRASDDPLNYPTRWRPVANGASFCPGPNLRGVCGRYFQARVIFRRPGGCPSTCDPELCWLKIECCKEGVGPADHPPVIEMPEKVEGLIVSAFVSDPDGDSLRAIWTVNGDEYARAIIEGEDSIAITLPNQKGVYEVALTVRDRFHSVSARTRACIGDQEPPVLICPDDRFPQGELRIIAFGGVIPDILSNVRATDNVTPSDQLVIRQTPAPGTVVSQGIHLITVTAEDEAGNIGRCDLVYAVKAVVEIEGFAKYATLEEGSTIEVRPVLNIPTRDVIKTEILVDGEVVERFEGLPSAFTELNLPSGGYSISIRVTDAQGRTSESSARLVRLDTPDTRPVGLVMESGDGKSVVAKFAIPHGVVCDLESSLSLDGNDWTHVKTVTGTGEMIEIEMDVTEDLPSLFFRVIPTTR